MENENKEPQALTQEDLDAHPELVVAGLKVGDMPIPADQLEDYTVTENDTALLAAGLKVGDVVPMPKKAPEPKMIKYTVVKGPIANAQAEVFQTGNDIEFEEGSELATTFLADGVIVPFGTAPANTAAVAPKPPVEAGATGDVEPRKRYRGQIVLAESDRTVGTQTFKHIRLADGSEQDLTEREYNAEVHISYPPHA